MKKIVAMLCALCMLMVTPAIAAEVASVHPVTDYSDAVDEGLVGEMEQPIEIGPYPGQEDSKISGIAIQYSDILADGNFDEVLTQMVESYLSNYTPSEEEYSYAENIIKFYHENFDGDIQTTSGFDDNWWLLRYGNLIEITLDLDEGITEKEAADMIAMAESAKDSAEKNFPNYWDSAQHFMWNFKMKNKYDSYKARTISINHEWGISMINVMLNTYESAYNDYIAKGYTDKRASDKALADAIIYMPQFKYDAVSIMKASREFFESFFSDESMMDFWNNCYGRAYLEPQYTAESAFRHSAFTAKELILDGKPMAENLTSDHVYSIWAWDWYSY